MLDCVLFCQIKQVWNNVEIYRQVVEDAFYGFKSTNLSYALKRRNGIQLLNYSVS